MGNKLPKEETLESYTIKHVTLGAMSVYDNYDLLQGKLNFFDLAKRFSEDEKMLEEVWEVTFEDDIPKDKKKIQMMPVVRGVFDFLDEFGRFIESSKE